MGRPLLVGALDVPTDAPGPAVAAVERAFAYTIHLVDSVGGPPLSAGDIAEIREDDGWASNFDRAAERDAAGAARDAGVRSGDAGGPGEDDNGEEVTHDEEE